MEMGTGRVVRRRRELGEGVFGGEEGESAFGSLCGRYHYSGGEGRIR